ncbi:MAG: DNA-protecting protein DprA [Ktedonobacterales bacterium]|nr:DNA-protecting protein DprA [Ktedonobacterales bacterium]
MEDAERPFWVAWNRVRGIGPARFARVLEVFGKAQIAWEAPLADLRATGFDDKLVEAIGRQRVKIEPEREMERLAHSGVTALTLRDDDYPRLLREISLPPAVLYVRGMLLPQDEMALAIVGTRRISTYGKQVTQRLATELVGRGLTIVSGLARGVDAIAHTAALEANGRTIAVLGCGPDLVYPPEHAKLAERIAAQGAVVSEFAVGMPPEAGNFPARNRIISGLSLATLLTEAPQGSGALITANFATDQGRDVLAVPGNITQRNSAGCNDLIKHGASCVTAVDDVVDALNLHLVPQQLDMRALLPEDPTEARILALLSDEPRHADEVCQMAQLPTGTVTSTLMMLELKGMARHLGNMLYVTA